MSTDITDSPDGADCEGWSEHLSRAAYSEPHIPPALHKASIDEFDYAVGLRDGKTIRFRGASWEKGNEWITLEQIQETDPPIGVDGDRFTFDRGLEVRIADIVWAADAPFGS